MVNYFSLDKTLLLIKLSSIAQSVEHAAVNRAVVGSSPTRGAENPQIHVCGFFVVIFQESIVLFSFQTFSHIEWRFQILL